MRKAFIATLKMQSLKTKPTQIDNSELIHTYYSGQKSSVKEKDPEPSEKKRPHYGLLTGFIILIIIAAFTGRHLFIKRIDPAVVKNEEAISITAGKYYNNILYYDYGQIKDNPATISLDKETTGLAITFKKDADLKDASLSFAARSKKGIEKLAVILKDTYNRSNANQNDAIITSDLRQDTWQVFHVDFKTMNLPLYKEKIKQLRFDTSSRLTDNKPDGEVYIKNIRITVN